MQIEGQGAQGAWRGAWREAGYAMAALLVSIAVMGILMSAVIPAWKTLVQREREQELVFRGEQYARAIGLFQRKYAGAFPPNVETLLQQKFLRKKYSDPITGDDFQILYQMTPMASGAPGAVGAATRPGQVVNAPVPVPAETGVGPVSGAPGTAGPRGGMVGVVSKSTQSSLRLYKGRGKYNEWQFVYTQASQGIGGPGQPPGQPRPGATPGMPGSMRPGGPPGSGRPGTILPPPGGLTPPRP